MRAYGRAWEESTQLQICKLQICKLSVTASGAKAVPDAKNLRQKCLSVHHDTQFQRHLQTCRR